MYTRYTFQDWMKYGASMETARMISDDFRASAEFRRALDANAYFEGHNPTLDQKFLLKMKTVESKLDNGLTKRVAQQYEVAGNRASSNYLKRFVCQQNQFLLGNGVTLDEGLKEKLGFGFDTALQNAGERALLHGACYGYWNLDHLEVMPLATDGGSGCFALVDERTGHLCVAIQFWQIHPDKPRYYRVFEQDGVWMFKDDDGDLSMVDEKRAYKKLVRRDSFGESVVGEENYIDLPVIALYANNEKRSEFTDSIKSKIDLYDRILSDFGDNLDRANDVYWALNNFGGTVDSALQVCEEIQRLHVALSQSDGNGSSSVEPKTIEVPYAARQAALEVLDKALYRDYMALSMDALTGGGLTNVAIQAAMTDINLKCDRFEWQCFRFVQQILRLCGIETEKIRFVRQVVANQSETIQNIYMMRSDIDQETALKLNPYIMPEEIEQIIANTEAERLSGQPSVDELQKLIDENKSGEV